MGLQFPRFKLESIFLDGFSAVSPDGKKLAAIVTGYTDSTATTSASSVWLFDLADTKIPPKLLAPSATFQTALPEWQSQQGGPAIPYGLSWKSNSASIVVMAISASTATPFSLFYDIDVASGKATPVVDFSQLPSSEAYFQPAPTGIIWRFYSPWTASMSPKNDKVLMFNNLGNATAILVGLLPPDGKLPGAAGSTGMYTGIPSALSSRSKDGKVLMYNVLFVVNEK